MTMIDRNEFFRQMTIRICSTLDIDLALQRCYDYLKGILPLDNLSLVFLDSEMTRGGMVAEVNEGKPGQSFQFEFEEFLNYNESLIALFREFWFDMQETTLVNHPDESEFSQAIYRFIKETRQISISYSTSSQLFLRLKLEDERLGVLTLAVEGYHQYTKEHAELLPLLNEPFAIALSNALRFHEISTLKDRLVDDNRFLRQKLNAPQMIVGSEFGLRRVVEMVEEVSAMNSPVLLLGETGTGKEVIANAIHASSPRRSKAFIKVNCGAIPESLIDSELFGYEKGAFTGAVSRKIGYFERADGGTIFLDEIGELPLPAQVRLLRVLQSQEFERVGGARPVTVDTRIIAATHRNLQEMIDEGTFREDLWFRLNVFPIFIPPLRQRPEDIPDLTLYFLRKKAEEMNLPMPELESGAFERLAAYRWRGNVRELENVIERALIRHRGGLLRIDPGPSAGPTPVAADNQAAPRKHVSLDAAMTEYITSVLVSTNWKISGPGGASNILELHPNTLRHRMTKLGIPLVRQQRDHGASEK